MGKAQETKGQVATLTAKLEAAYSTVKRLEADLKSAQRRLHSKSQEVTAARQARQEALTLLGKALAEDSTLRATVTELLADDARRMEDVAREAALTAAQMLLPNTETNA